MSTENYVFHYTGKMNQSFVMKSEDGTVVYEAICEKMTFLKDTAYQFRNCITGAESTKMIGHTLTKTIGFDNFSGNIDSHFTVDKVNVWEMLSNEGYGYHFYIKGLGICYDVSVNGEAAGTIEVAGSGAMDPKYANSPVGQVPANGIFRVSCSKENIDGFFMLCFAFTKTELAIRQMKL